MATPRSAGVRHWPSKKNCALAASRHCVDPLFLACSPYRLSVASCLAPWSSHVFDTRLSAAPSRCPSALSTPYTCPRTIPLAPLLLLQTLLRPAVPQEGVVPISTQFGAQEHQDQMGAHPDCSWHRLPRSVAAVQGAEERKAYTARHRR
ncbi:hypothetical protein P171DRAFT_50954 [Karstenula rhodostoma CBS 690.94]|uniref:Uncharacterized protein n=1 Tax=Karstenula rhodostoma CBS 690.94 TaxID=1392251 RepID=A0A9P4UB81_9PLEO|nr:hypothetical protein P171DRAFT_50954 [Karstenula rhodostoma CBS 690.94]